jgi:U32 family peptidase
MRGFAVSESSSFKVTRPELLAPGGDEACINAAIEGGADAVYFGLQSGFNARARAGNIGIEDLPQLTARMHRRSVKAYLTFNTLVFTSELDSAESFLRAAIDAGIDALIVQDLGIARLIRELSPDVPLHASTQMTLGSALSIKQAASLGLQRVILPRELSLADISKLTQETDVELEVFVHGALCMSYGGQCFASAAFGGRSANRGRCAQPCRLAYDLELDGKPYDTGSRRFPLSPSDLAGFRRVPDLMKAGVASLKIEGRLKSSDYVRRATQLYRDAIDAAYEQRDFSPEQERLDELELLFSRGSTEGWLSGRDDLTLVDARSSSKRGLQVGRVLNVKRDRIKVKLERPVRPGDGLHFLPGDEQGSAEKTSHLAQGGRVFHVYIEGRQVDQADAGRTVELAFHRDSLDSRLVQSGDVAWKTDDPRLKGKIRKENRSNKSVAQVGVDLDIVAKVGARLEVSARTTTDARCVVSSDDPLEQAQKHVLSEETLRKQFGRLGGTAYKLRALRLRMEGEPMAPLSVLGALRRQLVEQLDATPLGPHWTLRPEPVLPKILESVAQRTLDLDKDDKEVQIHVLCRTTDQVESILERRPSSITLDMSNDKVRRTAIDRIREQSDIQLCLATSRLPLRRSRDDINSVVSLIEEGPDAILARNLEAVSICRERKIPFVADAFLNAANPLTIDLLQGWGADRVTASYDLDRLEIHKLADALPFDSFEVVVHQHMPLFHTEYCLYRRFLGERSCKTCLSSPCSLTLRDRAGVAHPVSVSAGCRNTIFSGAPQSGSEYVESWRQVGVRDFRIEFSPATPPEESTRVFVIYRKLFNGHISGREAWKRLSSASSERVTRGVFSSQEVE